VCVPDAAAIIAKKASVFESFTNIGNNKTHQLTYEGLATWAMRPSGKSRTEIG
jgi:hypothetical protein